MFGFLIALEILISILLIVSVLMQSSKGGGLAGTFGGGNVGMMFGVRRTADFLTNATWSLATGFVALALLINIFFLPRTGSSEGEGVLQKSAPTQNSSAPASLPPTTTPPAPKK